MSFGRLQLTLVSAGMHVVIGLLVYLAHIIGYLRPFCMLAGSAAVTIFSVCCESGLTHVISVPYT